MTPIQEAIQHLKSLISDRAAPNDLVHGMEKGYENAIDYLESLLPKEKEFVGKVWDDAAERISNIFTKTFPESAIADKQQFINQLYPQS